MKQLPMESGYNFRDLGGIKTIDGQFVKEAVIFRADELSNLTDNDLQYLSNIPIISIIDFRSDSEVERNPDRIPESAKGVYHLPINPGNLTMDSFDFLKDPEFNPSEFMKNMNILMVTEEASIKQYQKFFEILQNKNEIPLIFHCTAGKDRTGMAAALFLYSLGVDENTIFENYLQSNIYLEDKYKSYIEMFPFLKNVLSVDKEYLQAGINTIKSECGSVEKYLTDVLKVDIKKIQEIYLCTE